jgi:hypothetical protein
MNPSILDYTLHGYNLRFLYEDNMVRRGAGNRVRENKAAI